MVFNSLGSNYNFKFALSGLFFGGNKKNSVQLKSYLEQKYNGQAILLYKAREAITLALRSLKLPKNSAVAINGYTCYAVYKAIVDAGLKPEYLDVEKGSLDFSAQQLEQAVNNNSNIKVAIIQNTLGYICNINNISQVCNQNNLILIEDLAHSVGAVYKNGQEAGTVGDFVVLSFSQDKIIDAVSGGALIVRNKKYQDKISFEAKPKTPKQLFVDRLYPWATFKIRTGYVFGLGKLTHLIYKKLNLLPRPMDGLDKIIIHNLPAWHAGMALYQFEQLAENLKHRKEVAEAYANNLNRNVLISNIVNGIPHSANLRFPILVKNRQGLIAYLKTFGIHVSDIWYDAPIAPQKYMAQTDYKGECPEAEKLSKEMVNLPTHININLGQAKQLAEKINQWLALQPKI